MADNYVMLFPNGPVDRTALNEASSFKMKIDMKGRGGPSDMNGTDVSSNQIAHYSIPDEIFNGGYINASWSDNPSKGNIRVLAVAIEIDHPNPWGPITPTVPPRGEKEDPAPTMIVYFSCDERNVKDNWKDFTVASNHL